MDVISSEETNNELIELLLQNPDLWPAITSASAKIDKLLKTDPTGFKDDELADGTWVGFVDPLGCNRASAKVFRRIQRIVLQITP